MRTIIKVIFIFLIILVIYSAWQLGKWSAMIQSLPQRNTPIFDNRVDTYNEIMLKNCLQNKNDSIR